MFTLRNILMRTIFCVAFIRVESEWIPYNGLWYYVSDESEKLTYTESEEKCNSLNGRLAAFSNWPQDGNKLANFTGSTKRWLSYARVIREFDTYNGDYTAVRYFLNTSVNSTNRYGYICDWQCHFLGVYPDAPQDFILKGVYSMSGDDSAIRRVYSKRLDNDSPQASIYQRWVGPSDGNDHEWYLEVENKDYAYKSSSHFTPYNYPYLWENINTSNNITIHFFCHDCWEYQVSLRNGSIIMSDKFNRKNINEEHKYINADEDSYLEYDSDGNQWCITWKLQLEEYCFDYLIAPTLNYTREYVSSDLDVVIYVSCTSTTIPVQQSTVDSMESETTIYSNVNVAETTAASAISSVTNSQADDTVTDEHGLTTNESRNSNVRLENKTTMYIAIACAIGGVVIIMFISLAVVCCRRRMKNKRKPDTEQSIQNNMRKSKANIYSVDTHSTNYIEIIDSSIVVENKTGKVTSEPLYEQAEDPTTENMYSEAEAVDVNNKHVCKNSFFPGSNKSQNEAGSHSSDKKTGNNTADDGNDSETEFFNNNIYEGNVNMDRKNAEVPQPVPVKSPSGSDIEMYNNTLYEASGKGIAQNNKSELVKNMDSVDEDIEMYDNDLYGS